MDRKPTYEELEQQVRELEKEVVKHKEVEECLVDLKRTEEALRLSEERLRLAIEGTADGIWDWNLESGEVYFSSRYYTMLGYDPDEFPASYESWRQLLHPDDAEAAEGVVERAVGAFDPNDAEATKEAVRRAVKEHSLYAVEFRLKAKDGEWRWILSRSKVVESDASGKAVRMAGSHTDITERKQAEEALGTRAQQYRIMTSTSMDGFAVVDAPGRILDVNEAYSHMIGYSRDELLKMSVSDIEAVDTPEGIREQHQKTITGGSDRFESRHRCKDGHIIDVEISMTFLPQSENILVFLRDITERKQAEEALRASQERLSLVIEGSNDGFWDWNVATGQAYFSSRYYTMLGYAPDEFPATYESWQSLIHPEDLAATEETLRRHFEEKLPTYSAELRLRTRSGDYRWILTRGKVVERDTEGKVVRMSGTHSDITERKQAEKALRESEALLSKLSEATWEAIIIHNRGMLIQANDQYYQMFGYEPAELLGKQAISMTATPESVKIIRKYINSEKTGPYEVIGMRKDGTEFPMEIRGKMMEYAGKKVRVAAIRDISERKQAEEALHESAEHLRIITDTSMDGFVVTDSGGNFLDVNEAYCKILGYSRYELLKMTVADIESIDTPDEIDERIKKATETGSNRFETRHRRKDGRIIDVEVSMTSIQQKSLHLNFVRDITERKQAEEALRASQERLSLVIEGSNDGFWDWNVATGQAYFSPRYYTMLGYAPDEFPATYENWQNLIHPEDLAATEDMLRRHFKEKIPTYAAELRLRTRSGDYRWILTRGKVVERDTEGKVVRMSGTHSDITERKQAEEALLREKHFSDTLIDSMPGVFYVFDEQGRFLRWNKRFESTTGYFAEEISHMKPRDFFAGEETDYISRKVQEVFTKGETEAEAGLMTKGGRTIPHFFTGVRILIGGKPHALGVGLDISDRKRAESQSARLQLLLKSVILQSPVPMALALPDGTVEIFNESCRTMLGAEDELDLQPGLNLFTMEASWKSYDARGVYIPLAESPLARALRGKTTRGRELKVVRKNRTERWILVDAVPIYDENGQIVAGFLIFPDITERKQAEQALENRLVALTQPLDATEGVAFEDLFNLSEIQRLQDLYAEAFGVAALITHPDGKPITRPSNFSELCGEIIRKTPKGCENCSRSDAMVGRPNPSGPNIQPCLSAGLCNAGASITVGGHHVANWLIGQVRNEAHKEEEIMAYAREIGADETAFRAAYRKLSVMSQEQFERVAHVLFELANQTSTTAYQNVQQARFIAERKRAEEAIRFMNTILLTQQETSIDGILVVDDEGKIISFNRKFVDMWDIPSDVIESRSGELAIKSVIDKLIEPEEFLARIKHLYEHRNEKSFDTIELVNGKTFERYSAPMVGQEGKYYGRVWYLRDITERKKREETLRKRETELEIQSHHLQEVNAALKVLLRQREEDKKELQESVVANVEELVFPYLEKLSEAKIDDRHRAYIKIMISNLNDIISPFIGVLSSRFMKLTPTEVQVANLIKHGKTTKDIAEMLNLSAETIKFHRKNIRDKIGLKNKKANLRTHLLSVR